MIGYLDGWYACILGAPFSSSKSNNWQMGWLTAQEFQL